MRNRIAAHLDAQSAEPAGCIGADDDDTKESLVWDGGRLCLKDATGRKRLVGWRESVEWLAKMESADLMWCPRARERYYRLLARQLFT